jgi:hypothetical protein
MVFSAFVPSTIPTSLALEVSGGGTSQSEPFDVNLGGFKFMLAAGPESPLIRRGAPYRTEQVNFSGDPGELALGFWWQRSQDTWHFGAGNPTFDGPGSGDPTLAVGRFFTSEGMDVWVPGEFRLLRDVDAVEAVASDAANLCVVNVGSDPGVAWTEGSTVFLYSNGSVFSGAASGTLESMCSDGTNLYAVAGTVIYKDPPTGGSTDLYTSGVTGDAFVLRWAKSRLMLGMDNSIYQLDPSVSSAALPSPLYTHPNPDWVWTDIESGPGAIYASGFAGPNSAVFKFVLESDGALPTLSSGITACELPDGEQALSLKSYLLSFIGIGTSEGLRVCSFVDTDISLAPLTYSDSPVVDLASSSRFLYATTEDAGTGACGLIRVDLSVLTDNGVYAWANDLRANSDPAGFTAVAGSPVGVAVIDNSPLFLVPGESLFEMASDRYAVSGSLTTGRILFGMSDPKVFQRLGFVGGGAGTVALYTGTDSGSASIFRTSIDMAVRNKIEVDIGSSKGSTLTLRFELTRATEDSSPSVESFQAKALPAQAREDQYILPLRCYDRTENRYGQTEWQRAITTLNAVSQMVRSQEPVTLQFFFGDVAEWVTLVVQLEDFEFRQVTCESEDGWGGVLTVSCRTLLGEQD